jgi:2-polyprenyl-6-methoxyphenol hydroxylase-like FAD-dependent oxidoreductase
VFVPQDVGELIYAGAGQGGLVAAARLKMLGIQALLVDRNDRVGDNWRKRYHQLGNLPNGLQPPFWC